MHNIRRYYDLSVDFFIKKMESQPKQFVNPKELKRISIEKRMKKAFSQNHKRSQSIDPTFVKHAKEFQLKQDVKEPSLLDTYSAMKDKHLQNHFLYEPVRQHLKGMGLINNKGFIIPNPDYDIMHARYLAQKEFSVLGGFTEEQYRILFENKKLNPFTIKQRQLADQTEKRSENYIISKSPLKLPNVKQRQNEKDALSTQNESANLHQPLSQSKFEISTQLHANSNVYLQEQIPKAKRIKKQNKEGARHGRSQSTITTKVGLQKQQQPNALKKGLVPISNFQHSDDTETQKIPFKEMQNQRNILKEFQQKSKNQNFEQKLQSLKSIQHENQKIIDMYRFRQEGNTIKIQAQQKKLDRSASPQGLEQNATAQSFKKAQLLATNANLSIPVTITKIEKVTSYAQKTLQNQAKGGSQNLNQIQIQIQMQSPIKPSLLTTNNIAQDTIATTPIKQRVDAHEDRRDSTSKKQDSTTLNIEALMHKLDGQDTTTNYQQNNQNHQHIEEVSGEADGQLQIQTRSKAKSGNSRTSEKMKESAGGRSKAVSVRSQSSKSQKSLKDKDKDDDSRRSLNSKLIDNNNINVEEGNLEQNQEEVPQNDVSQNNIKNYQKEIGQEEEEEEEKRKENIQQ